MKLYCVRHAEAMQPDVDPQRGLTPKGRADVTKIAQYLGYRGVHVAHIFHSAKLRARQTAEILAANINTGQISENDALLGEQNSVEPMLEMIGTWSEDTLLVGHLPSMSKLVSALVVGNEEQYPIVNFPPGTVVCLEYYEHHRWIINWLLRPNIVPEICV